MDRWMETIASIFEATGAGALVLGLLLAAYVGISHWIRNREPRQAVRLFREAFGGAILLALEILVAADLVRTVAVHPTMENVAVLGFIVLIRTVLSFSLEIEIEGIPPWKRALVSGATVMGNAAQKARRDGG